MNDVHKCEPVIRSFEKDSKICKLLLQKWRILEEILNVLKVMYQATIVMQKEDFRLSDFFATWNFIDNKLKRLASRENSTGLANEMINKLADRKRQLLDNPAMSAAQVLDPRFCKDLNDVQMDMAVKALESLHKQLLNLNKGEDDHNEPESSDDDDITVINTTNLSKYCQSNKSMSQIVTQNPAVPIRECVGAFVAANHVLTDGTILDFWNSNKLEYSDLYALAMVILSISPTQVIVERSFSVLSYVFNRLRNRLSDQMLEDILVIALNVELFHEVNQEDIDAIRNAK